MCVEYQGVDSQVMEGSDDIWKLGEECLMKVKENHEARKVRVAGDSLRSSLGMVHGESITHGRWLTQSRLEISFACTADLSE